MSLPRTVFPRSRYPMAATARPGLVCRALRSARRRILLALWLVQPTGTAPIATGVTEADRRDERHRGPVWLPRRQAQSHRGDPAPSAYVLVVVRPPACDLSPTPLLTPRLWPELSLRHRKPQSRPLRRSRPRRAHPDARPQVAHWSMSRSHVRHRDFESTNRTAPIRARRTHRGGDTPAAPLTTVTPRQRGTCRCRAESSPTGSGPLLPLGHAENDAVSTGWRDGCSGAVQRRECGSPTPPLRLRRPLSCGSGRALGRTWHVQAYGASQGWILPGNSDRGRPAHRPARRRLSAPIPPAGWRSRQAQHVPMSSPTATDAVSFLIVGTSSRACRDAVAELDYPRDRGRRATDTFPPGEG